MPAAFWFSLKRSLQCKSEESDVHHPKAKTKLMSNSPTCKLCRSGCSRSISNLRDVIHGSNSKRHTEKPPCCSPMSLGSNDVLNPISHEVILSNSTCELKITTGFDGNAVGKGGSNYVGSLKPGTPGLGSDPIVPPHYSSKMMHGISSKMDDSPVHGSGDSNSLSSEPRTSHVDTHFYDPSTLTCKKCGDKFKKLDALQEHHLSNHAVTELLEGDSSRRIVEIICRTTWLKSENNRVLIERVLKVHNLQITLAQFEEYRDLVKIKAGKLPTKHPRCLADGNELLRFFGTTIACSFGMNRLYDLCTLDKCGVCQILRHGFTKREFNGGIGIFTTSTSGRALESIEHYSDHEEGQSERKGLLVCRVIAGRVHRPLQNLQDMSLQLGFDSLAGKVSHQSIVEELYLLNPKALLPCFVVICKT